MKTINSKIEFAAALVLCAAPLFFGTPARAGEYRQFAESLSAAAAGNGITRVALGTFGAASGSVEEEARFASEKTASGLAADRRLEVLDQAALEAQGGKDGWLSRLPSKLRPQALIKGMVFKEGDRVTVMARLVDAASGRVLATLETTSSARFTDLPPVPDMDWGAPPAVAPVGNLFRDAPSDGEFDCSAAFKDMDRLNEQAVDLKARYWAAKMKEKGFLLGSLTRNPGSEIRDPQVKQKFYELLSDYHGKDSAPLAAGQVKKLEEFMGRENGVIDRCGIK